MKKIFVTILIFTFILTLTAVSYAQEGKDNAIYKKMTAHINDSTGMVDAIDIELKTANDPFPSIIDTATNFWSNLNAIGLCKNPGDPGGEGIRVFKNFPDTSNPANEIQDFATTGCEVYDNYFRVYLDEIIDPCNPAKFPLGLGFVNRGKFDIDILDHVISLPDDQIVSWWPDSVKAPKPAFTAMTIQDSLDGCDTYPYWNVLVNDSTYHDNDPCDYNYHWGVFTLNVNEDSGSDYYLDLADGYDTDVNFKLEDGGYFPFYLDTSSLPTSYYTWWSAKGVVSGATGWQGHMWDIINGVEPMLYVYYDENGTNPPIYKIIDGLQKDYAMVDQYLRIPGDYPQLTYTLYGQVMGCNDEISDSVFVQLNIQGCDNPEVVDITTSTDLIDDCVDTFAVCVEYDQNMNTTIVPTVTFDPDLSSMFYTPYFSGWISSTTYCLRYYTSAIMDTAIFGIDVSVDGAVNEYCCPQVPYMEQDVFDIYTLNPTGDISFNHNIIDNCKDTLEVTICYDDSMCLQYEPDIYFMPDVIGTLLNPVGTPMWISNDCFQWKYEILDSSMTGTVGVEVTGAQNWTCCNYQNTAYNDFYVDTEIPVPDVVAYPNPINGCWIDSMFTVTAYYSDSMCISVPPTITFDPNVDHTLSLVSESWLNNYDYQWQYTILDADTTINDVQFVVEGAMDWTCCNMQEPDTSFIDINTDSPVVDYITVSDTFLTLCDYYPFTVCVTYDREMDTSVEPIISFDPADVDTILTAGGGSSWGSWIDSLTYCLNYSWYNWPEVDIRDIDVLVDGARGIIDTCSYQVPYIEFDVFDIDWDRPEVIDIMVSDDCVGSCDTAFTVTVEYDEAMCDCPLPTIVFDNPAPSPNPFTFDSGSWLDDFTAELNYTVSDVDAYGCDVDVIVTDAIDATCCSLNVQYPDTLVDAFNVDQQEPYSNIYDASYDDSTCIISADWYASDEGCPMQPPCLEKVEFYLWKEGGTPALVYTDTTGELSGSISYDLTTIPGVETLCVEGMWYAYSKAYDCCCNVEEKTMADDSVNVSFDATHFVIKAYDHNTGSDTLREGKYFDVEITAVNDCGLRDCDFEACIQGCTNYNEDQVDLTLFSNPTMMYEGHMISEHNVANMTMNDLLIHVWKCPCCDMYSTSDPITVLLPSIEPPTNTAAYDVPDDQGGWISVDYTLSLQDPFHSTHDPMLNPVYQPFIDYYVIERNTAVDTSGTWNAIAFVDLYDPSDGDNAHVDIQVPAGDEMYPYRMAAVYNYGALLFKEHGEDAPKVMYDTEITKGSQQSNYANCGSAAGMDNIPAYANTKVFLEGPYQTGGYMTDDIDLPTVSPYDGEDIGALPVIPGRILIDWIHVELRNSETGATVQEANAFVLDNGMIVNTNGEYSLPFFYTTGNEYYLVIHHRNHIDIMSTAKHPFGDAASEASSIDLTVAGSAYNDGFKEVETDVYALYAGDASDNNQIQNDDKNDYWANQVGQAGYLSADFNLNGQVQNDDKNDFWQYNVGIGSQIPDQAKNTANNTTQKDDAKAGVTYSFENCTISSGYLEFDVMLAADVEDTYLGDNQVYFNYNAAGFGSNVVDNSKITVSKGTLLQGDVLGDDLYTILSIQDNSPSRVAITNVYNYASSPSWANEIPTTPTKLLHISIEIDDPSENSAISFQEGLMDEQTYESDNTVKYSITATDVCDQTLPVELLSFTALYSDVNNNVEIKWTTASENDVSGYNIHRSTNNEIPEEKINVSLIEGIGNTTEQHNYVFEDETANINDPYNYWLEVINFDGTYSYHGPINYTPGDTDGDGTSDYQFDVTRLVGNFPNPVVNSTTIQYQIKGSLQNQDAIIKVYNIRGELVKTLNGRAGKATLNASDLGQGIYFYRLQTNDYSYTKKLVIVK